MRAHRHQHTENTTLRCPHPGDETSEHRVEASCSGVVIGRTNIPLVNEGEALFHIARFNSPEEVADSVEAFNTRLDPATDTGVPEEQPII